MTDKQLVNKYRALDRKISKMVDKLINSGYGTEQPSTLRKMENKPKIVQDYLALIDQSVNLRMEAERRYGPGLIVVDQLCWK